MAAAENIAPEPVPFAVYAALNERYAVLEKSYTEALAAIARLQFDLSQVKKAIYGSSSERFVAVDKNALQQGVLFDMPAEAEVKEETYTLPERQVKKITKTAPHPGRLPLSSDLRRETTVIEPEEIAGLDRRYLKEVGREVTEQLAYTASELYVKRVERPRFVDSSTEKFYMAALPAEGLPKCSADASMLARVVVDKYVDHLPLYRQAKRYARLGQPLSDSTLGEWIKTTATLIRPVYESLHKLIFTSAYIHVDETTIGVLSSEKKNASHQGYYWVYQSHQEKLILFEYQPGRGYKHTHPALQTYKGYLQTDGYKVYEQIGKSPEIHPLYCWAHARRKFIESKNNAPALSEEALVQIQSLYALERKLQQEGASVEEVLQQRQKVAVPLLEKFHNWLEEVYKYKALPASALGKATAYSLTRWDGLTAYTKDGILAIDNNPVENSIRPVAIGRKNYLFAGSHEAAQRAAHFYSLFATCAAHEVNPFEWLEDVLRRINNHPINRIEELLPHRWKELKNQ